MTLTCKNSLIEIWVARDSKSESWHVEPGQPASQAEFESNRGVTYDVCMCFTLNKKPVMVASFSQRGAAPYMLSQLQKKQTLRRGLQGECRLFNRAGRTGRPLHRGAVLPARPVRPLFALRRRVCPTPGPPRTTSAIHIHVFN